MDSLEFAPDQEYLKLIQESDGRKSKLNLVGLTYSQLSRKKLFREYGYELHHIEPRYRLKNGPSSYLNRPENIAVLTTREHLLAHLYLARFETGRFRYSAQMALIQLWSLKSSTDYVLNLPENELCILLDGVEESRKNYFGSLQHKEGSSKAGKIAGAIRKASFENDPEFREYMLSKLRLSDDKKLEISAAKKERKGDAPPWRMNKIKKTKGKDYKYSLQLWELFDSIYEGLFKYKLSYKAIAKILDVDYQRISNIVRIMKRKTEALPVNFDEYRFYKEFGEDYRYTHLDNRPIFEEYVAKNAIKGVYRHSTTDKWVAQITVNKKSMYLGVFENFNEALKARKEAEIGIAVDNLP